MSNNSHEGRVEVAMSATEQRWQLLRYATGNYLAAHEAAYGPTAAPAYRPETQGQNLDLGMQNRIGGAATEGISNGIA